MSLIDLSVIFNAPHPAALLYQRNSIVDHKGFYLSGNNKITLHCLEGLLNMLFVSLAHAHFLPPPASPSPPSPQALSDIKTGLAFTFRHVLPHLNI